ncbi:hypothetical protein Tco_0649195 [Tanacetum coccineum]
MMTARKRVGPLPTLRFAVRHSADHSSSDSSSEASSDFHSDASSDSSLRHSLPDHSSPDLPSTSARPSRKRRRSPMTSVPVLPLVFGALSPVRADLIPSPKRIRSLETATDLEARSRGTDIEVDDDVERSDMMDIDPVEAVIKACFDFADIIGASGVDVRDEAVIVDRDDVTFEPAQEGAAGSTYETLGDLVQRFHDNTEALSVHRIQLLRASRGSRDIGLLGLSRQSLL